MAVEGGDDLRPHPVEHLVLRVLEEAQRLDGAPELLLEEPVEDFKVRGVFRDRAVHRAPHRVEQDEGVHVLVAVFPPGNAEPLAPAHRDSPRDVGVHPRAQLTVDEQVVVGQRRHARPVPDEHVAGVAEEGGVHVLVPHEEEVVIVVDHVVGFQHDEAHLTARVAAVPQPPADREVLPAHL